ncbi:MAG: MCE family protein [Rhodococcus sp. (in: high G+C Gram-positive bacteria)]|uniref:MCE family protein n=1 Tax=Rhodococcus sp. TaxID=1831 RepID=UPI003BAF8098
MTGRRYTGWIIGFVALALVVSAVTYAAVRAQTKHATIYFTNSAGMYVGDPVSVLGVPIGTIDEIVPDGSRVRVEVSYDSKYQVPADTKAAIVSPTLVTGRYVQFAPVYEGGPVLEDGAVIDVDRTAVPVEFDQVKEQLAQMASDLGPEGLNADGSVNRFLESTATAFDGKGRSIHDTIVALSEASATLEGGSDDFFGTVNGLQTFVTALAQSDRDVVGFSNELTSVSQVLNNNRTELDAALHALGPAMTNVQQFVADNRDALSTDLSELTKVSGLLVERIDEIAAVLHIAPTALSNLYNIYDRDANSLTGALMVPDKVDPLKLICGLVTTVGAPQQECANVTDALRGAAVSPASMEGLMMPTTGGGR